MVTSSGPVWLPGVPGMAEEDNCMAEEDMCIAEDDMCLAEKSMVLWARSTRLGSVKGSTQRSSARTRDEMGPSIMVDG